MYSFQDVYNGHILEAYNTQGSLLYMTNDGFLLQ